MVRRPDRAATRSVGHPSDQGNRQPEVPVCALAPPPADDGEAVRTRHTACLPLLIAQEGLMMKTKSRRVICLLFGLAAAGRGGSAPSSSASDAGADATTDGPAGPTGRGLI